MTEGRSNTTMMSYSEVLSEEEMQDIVVFIPLEKRIECFSFTKNPFFPKTEILRNRRWVQIHKRDFPLSASEVILM